MLPNLTTRQLYNISFGFFGVQIAYALQSANISRIFTTLGADPHDLSFFWILPPLMGMVVQPIIGYFSDKTWCRMGRRKPYLIFGALIALLVMILLPNAGSFGLTTQVVMWGMTGTMLFGLFSLMLLDTSINTAMQPFKMMVGDMVNEEQKSKAYSIQAMLCNAGSIVGFCAPYILTFLGIQNVAEDGVVPNSVIYSFYIGAGILILCVLYTCFNVKEMDPQQYAEAHHLGSASQTVATEAQDPAKKGGVGRAFLTIGLVQFFCWAAFLYQWTYATGAIADNCWGTTDAKSLGYQDAGNWYGIMSAVMAIGAVVWAPIIPTFKHRVKLVYIVSLLIGAAGFASCFLITNQYLLILSFLAQGCAWAAMLALPFTLFTNAIEGNPRMGTLLGLFNCVICLPQIIAASTGGMVLSLVGSQPMMLVMAGIYLVLGACCVTFIKTGRN